MKKALSVTAFILLGSALLIPKRGPVSTQDLSSLSSNDFVADEVLVQFGADTDRFSALAIIESVQGNVITYNKAIVEASEWNAAANSNVSFIDMPLLVHLRVPPSIGTINAINQLTKFPNVVIAEPNLKYHFFDDDEYFPIQWALNNDDDNDIDAPEAWEITTGNSDIIVAIIDTGIDLAHEDLANNTWRNPFESGEYASDREDNDENGYKDDYAGWNFVSGNNDLTDANGHGTHVAGIIGAEHDNPGKVKGVCGHVGLMTLKAFNLELDELVPAVLYAVNNGAKIINASWGDNNYSQLLYNAISYAHSKGVLFIAAAGNKDDFPNANNDTNPIYPASYNLPNIISVLSTSYDDTISSFSHYGAASVDLGAPGGGNSIDIMSTLPDDGYDYLAGTSMAAPFVTGAAALAMAQCPLITVSQLKSRMLNTPDYLSALDNLCVSEGRLNVYSLVYDAAAPNGTPDSLNGTWLSWGSYTVNWADNSSNEIGFDVQRQKSGEGDFSTIICSDANTTSHLDTSVSGSTSYYRIRVYNMAGYSSYSSTHTATAPAGAPSAPTNFAAQTPAPEYHIELSWDDNANNEQVFVVQRRSFGSGIWTTVGSSVSTDPYTLHPTINWMDTSTGQGTYYYRVKATNPNGSSSYSSEILVEVIGN